MNKKIVRHDLAIDNSFPGLNTNNPLFDPCGKDSLMALSVVGGYSRLFDWLGVEPTNVQRLEEYAITYMATKGMAAGNKAIPWHADPCADGVGVEYGACSIVHEGFGRLRVSSPVKDVTQANIVQCEQQPRFRIDGSRIEDETEWGLVLATQAIMQSLHRALIVGNKANGEQEFDGFQRLIRTGYTDPKTGQACPALDSVVVDYASNAVCPTTAPTGVTWNGDALTGDYNLIDVVKQIFRWINARVKASSTLGGRRLQTGNMIIVMPNSMIECFLDCWICHKYCEDGEALNNLESQRLLEELQTGYFDDGYIRIGNLIIPILGYDQELINADGTFDMLILTNRVGNQPLMRFQYLDYSRLVNPNNFQYGVPFQTMDRGMLLTWPNTDNTCSGHQVEFQGRLVIGAPWAQARISNINCDQITRPFSTDPSSLFYFQNPLTALENQTPPLTP